MPRRDGTGPMGQGPVTGRGLGSCTGVNAGFNVGAGRGLGRMGRGLGLGLGIGLGCARGFGRYFWNNSAPANNRELLEEEKNILTKRMEAIDNILKGNQQNNE